MAVLSNKTNACIYGIYTLSNKNAVCTDAGAAAAAATFSLIRSLFPR